MHFIDPTLFAISCGIFLCLFLGTDMLIHEFTDWSKRAREAVAWFVGIVPATLVATGQFSWHILVLSAGYCVVMRWYDDYERQF